MQKEKYKWIEDELEFIKLRPDTYIGSTNKQNIDSFILKENKLISKKLNTSPGLFQIFNEVITNSVDEHIRNPHKLNQIKVKINTKKNEITVYDNGGIEVRKHSDFDIYIPDLIVSKLRAGSNLDDNEQRKVAGRNGLGSSITNIMSLEFSIETCDGINVFYKKYSNNLSKHGKISITEAKDKQGYTEIKFKPDLERFDCIELEEDFIHLVRKKILDIAACNTELKLYLTIDDNTTEKYKFNTFKDYCQYYLKDDKEVIFEDSNDWNICVGNSNTKDFQFVSFVNKLEVINGGEHIKYISDQITFWLKEQIQKKYKVNVTTSNIKQHLFLFVNCNIVNPSFGSQTKIELTTKPSEFGTYHTISEKFLNKLFKSEMLQDIVDWAQKRLELEEEKKINLENKKLDKVNVEKLIDAKSKDRTNCEIFIMEGNCLSPKTKIKIINNSNIIDKEIRNVNLNDLVITHNNRLCPVTNIFQTIKQKVIIKINNEEIICSSDHRWLVYDINDKIFMFLATNKIDKNKHKLIKNILTNLIDLYVINNIEYKEDIIKFITIESDFNIKYDNEILIYNIMNNIFEIKSANDINKENDLLVNYSLPSNK
jgi:DNA topoisomerase-2